jgi:hypothetical protein
VTGCPSAIVYAVGHAIEGPVVSILNFCDVAVVTILEFLLNVALYEYPVPSITGEPKTAAIALNGRIAHPILVATVTSIVNGILNQIPGRDSLATWTVACIGKSPSAGSVTFHPKGNDPEYIYGTHGIFCVVNVRTVGVSKIDNVVAALAIPPTSSMTLSVTGKIVVLLADGPNPSNDWICDHTNKTVLPVPSVTPSLLISQRYQVLATVSHPADPLSVNVSPSNIVYAPPART